MTQALELNRWDMPTGATVVTGAAAERRQRSSRAAYDRILDRANAAERQKTTDALTAAVRNHPAMKQEQHRIETSRNSLSRRGESVAVAGALAIIGLVAGLCMTAAPLQAQASAVLVGALGLAGFRLAMMEGRLLLGPQIIVQLFASLILLLVASPGAETGFLGAIALMGWGAVGLRALQLSASRRLDIDEVELLLKAQGRQTIWAVREDMQRRIAAAI